MKKRVLFLSLIAALLALFLALSGCGDLSVLTALKAAKSGKDGNIYGSITWDYFIYYASLGGFPTSIFESSEYMISPGTYNVLYTLWDFGLNYSPGPGPSYYWQSTYTVAADPGSYPLVNGKDHYFKLHLTWGGLIKSGAVQYIETPAQYSKSTAPKLGAQSWTEDGLLITVTNEIVKLSPEDLSKIQETQTTK